MPYISSKLGTSQIRIFNYSTCMTFQHCYQSVLEITATDSRMLLSNQSY